MTWGISTVCAECRDDLPALNQADDTERAWERYPIEVSERKCRRCKIRQHWWWFWRSDFRRRIR